MIIYFMKSEVKKINRYSNIGIFVLILIKCFKYNLVAFNIVN